MLRIGEVYRYAKIKSRALPYVDGLPNYFYETSTPGENLPLLEAGINPVGRVHAVDGDRCPAILISSSPHRIGSKETPWQDFFEPDSGHIRYFGDNGQPGIDPSNTHGNSILLRQFDVHYSPSRTVREKAVPIIFFRRVKKGDRVKGNVQFQGFGIISEVHRVIQPKPRTDLSFTNYAFHFVVLSMFDARALCDSSLQVRMKYISWSANN